jgi:hypothetical protein
MKQLLITIAAAVLIGCSKSEEQGFAQQPLVVSGGTGNIVQANPEKVAQDDPLLRAAHFTFVIDPLLEAHVMDEFEGNVPDKFFWQARKIYRIDEKKYSLKYSIDGREHVLNAGGQRFELVDGNYFRFHILSGPTLFVDQLPVVDTIGDSASESVQSQVSAVFDAHPSRARIPKASRTTIPEAKANRPSNIQQNLRRLGEELKTEDK